MSSDSNHERHWQLDLVDIVSRGRYLLRSGLWADVEFAVGEHKNVIKAHRLALASASPVFANMLYSPSDVEMSPIYIPDIRLEIFNLLLEYIYTDKIDELPVDKLSELIIVSKKYLLPQFTTACAKTLMKQVTPDNAIRCYEFAATTEFQPLRDECTKVFSLYTMQILEAGILHASIETLESIFSLDCLTLGSEFDLLTVVEKYAKDAKMEDDVRAQNIRRLLKKIRFLAVDVSELANHHERLRAFLSESELLNIIINNAADVKGSMPEGFTTISYERKIMVPYVKDIQSIVAVGRVFTIVGCVRPHTARETERIPSSAGQTNVHRDSICVLNVSSGEFFSTEDSQILNSPQNNIFTIDLQENEDSWTTNDPFHISVRFDDPQGDGCVVVRNTYQNGWGREEREGGMPFQLGKKFDLTIEILADRFKVCVDGNFFCYYNHRLPIEQIKYLSIMGGIDLNYVA